MLKSAKRVQSGTDKPLYYSMESGHILEISSEALNVLARHRQVHFWQSEAGGQLFAEIGDKWIRVVRAGSPKKKDIRTRFAFLPHRASEQEEINTQFRRGLHYVGDWHSHAEDVPVPSFTDVRSINEMVRESKHNLSGFLLVVVGRKAFPEGLFVAVANGERVAQLAPAVIS